MGEMINPEAVYKAQSIGLPDGTNTHCPLRVALQKYVDTALLNTMTDENNYLICNSGEMPYLGLVKNQININASYAIVVADWDTNAATLCDDATFGATTPRGTDMRCFCGSSNFECAYKGQQCRCTANTVIFYSYPNAGTELDLNYDWTTKSDYQAGNSVQCKISNFDNPNYQLPANQNREIKCFCGPKNTQDNSVVLVDTAHRINFYDATYYKYDVLSLAQATQQTFRYFYEKGTWDEKTDSESLLSQTSNTFQISVGCTELVAQVEAFQYARTASCIFAIPETAIASTNVECKIVTAPTVPAYIYSTKDSSDPTIVNQLSKTYDRFELSGTQYQFVPFDGLQTSLTWDATANDNREVDIKFYVKFMLENGQELFVENQFGIYCDQYDCPYEKVVAKVPTLRIVKNVGESVVGSNQTAERVDDSFADSYAKCELYGLIFEDLEMKKPWSDASIEVANSSSSLLYQNASAFYLKIDTNRPYVNKQIYLVGQNRARIKSEVITVTVTICDSVQLHSQTYEINESFLVAPGTFRTISFSSAISTISTTDCPISTFSIADSLSLTPDGRPLSFSATPGNYSFPSPGTLSLSLTEPFKWTSQSLIIHGNNLNMSAVIPIKINVVNCTQDVRVKQYEPRILQMSTIEENPVIYEIYEAINQHELCEVKEVIMVKVTDTKTQKKEEDVSNFKVEIVEQMQGVKVRLTILNPSLLKNKQEYQIFFYIKHGNSNSGVFKQKLQIIEKIYYNYAPEIIDGEQTIYFKENEVMTKKYQIFDVNPQDGVEITQTLFGGQNITHKMPLNVSIESDETQKLLVISTRKGILDLIEAGPVTLNITLQDIPPMDESGTKIYEPNSTQIIRVFEGKYERNGNFTPDFEGFQDHFEKFKNSTNSIIKDNDKKEKIELPDMKFDKISRTGDFKVKFTKEMQPWTDQQLQQINANLSSPDSALELLPFELIPLASEYTNASDFTIANISHISHTEQTLEFKLNFTNAKIISMSGIRDQMGLQVTDSTFFKDTDGLQIEEGKFIIGQMPAQLEQNEDLEQLLVEAEQTKDALGAFVIGNAILLYLFGYSLNKVWGLVGAMQLPTHFVLLNISFPAKVNLYFQVVLEIANFSVYSFVGLGGLFDKYLGFTMIEDSPLTPSLNEFGYSSQIWIISMSSGFVFICYQLTFFIFGYIFGPCLQKYKKFLETKFEEELQKKNKKIKILIQESQEITQGVKKSRIGEQKRRIMELEASEQDGRQSDEEEKEEERASKEDDQKSNEELILERNQILQELKKLRLEKDALQKEGGQEEEASDKEEDKSSNQEDSSSIEEQKSPDEASSRASKKEEASDQKFNQKMKDLEEILDDEPKKWTILWFVTTILKKHQAIPSNMKSFVIGWYMTLVILFWICLFSLFKNEDLGELALGDYLSLFFWGIFSIIILFLPLYVLWRYKYLKENLSHSDNALLLGVNSRSENNALYPIFFMLKRIILITLVMVFDREDSVDKYISISVLMYMQVIYMAYLLHAKPIDQYRLQVVNEFIVMVKTYIMLIISGVEANIQHIDFIGERLINLLFLQMFINIVNVSLGIFGNCKSKYKSNERDQLKVKWIKKKNQLQLQSSKELFEQAKQKVQQLPKQQREIIFFIRQYQMVAINSEFFVKETLHRLESKISFNKREKPLNRLIRNEWQNMEKEEQKLIMGFYICNLEETEKVNSYEKLKDIEKWKTLYKEARNYFNGKRKLFHVNDQFILEDGELQEVSKIEKIRIKELNKKQKEERKQRKIDKKLKKQQEEQAEKERREDELVREQQNFYEFYLKKEAILSHQKIWQKNMSNEDWDTLVLSTPIEVDEDTIQQYIKDEHHRIFTETIFEDKYGYSIPSLEYTDRDGKIHLKSDLTSCPPPDFRYALPFGSVYKQVNFTFWNRVVESWSYEKAFKREKEITVRYQKRQEKEVQEKEEKRERLYQIYREKKQMEEKQRVVMGDIEIIQEEQQESSDYNSSENEK